MPLAKHRPDFAELIAIAAVQRKNILKRKKKHYSDVRKNKSAQSTRTKYSTETVHGPRLEEVEAPECPDEKENLSPEKPDNSEKPSLRSAFNVLTHDSIIDVSDKIRWLLDLYIVRCLRLSVVFLAFLNLTYEAQTKKGDNPNYDTAANISDIIVAVYFIVEGTLKVFAFYAHMDMQKAFDLKIESVMYFQKLGFLDILLGVFSLYFGDNTIGGWFRLLRVMMFSSFALDETPHLVVIMSGITQGLKSILSTCLLLFLVFIVYAAFALFFFEKNDPYHFGTIALGMWSFFELATLDNWSQVMYVNMYGCDKFPAYYTVVNSSYTGKLSISRYGSTLMLPICTTPEKHPVIAAIMFLSFIVICAFILVNLTIAAVTSGINVRLDRIKDEGGNDVMALSEMLGGNMSTIHGNTDINKLLIADPDMLLIMLKQVWKEQDAHARKMKREKNNTALIKKKKHKSIDRSSLDLHAHSKVALTSSISTATISTGGLSSNPSLRSLSSKSHSHSMSEDDDHLHDEHHADINYFEWRGQSILFRDILSHYSYQFVIFGMIAFSALLVLVVLQRGDTHLLIKVTNLILQIFFSMDLYVQIVAAYPNVSFFFKNNWQLFDAIVVVVTWIPVFAWGRGSGVLDLLNIFRIVRLLKLLRWIHELNVILHSVASSAIAIFYVYVLIFGLAFHFAVAGVFLFAKNDPQHFHDLGTSIVTLFQIQSLDDWSEVARTNMYGCDYWGYDTGEDYYDSQCVSPHGLGWFAALYFTIYIMMSVMVLLSLFVGIIITAMELLKEGIKEENEVWEKVKIQQKRYNMRDATVNNLLEIFDIIDVCKNGKLTLLELKPIFDIITISEASQFSLFMMVDTDNSGQIDFAEFLELLYLVGKAYKVQRKHKHNKHKHKDETAHDDKTDVQTDDKQSTGDNAAHKRRGSTNRKVYPTKLSVVTDGDEEEPGQSVKATAKSHVSENEESQRSIFSQDSECAKGPPEEIDRNFFEKEFHHSHENFPDDSDHHTLTHSNHTSRRTPLSRDNSKTNFNSDQDQDHGLSSEKTPLNISFFQKEKGSPVTSPALQKGGHNSSEQELLNISFFQRQMGSQASILSEATHNTTSERRKSSDSQQALSRGMSKAMLDLSYREGEDGGEEKSLVGGDDEDVRTIYKAEE